MGRCTPDHAGIALGPRSKSKSSRAKGGRVTRRTPPLNLMETLKLGSSWGWELGTGWIAPNRRLVFVSCKESVRAAYHSINTMTLSGGSSEQALQPLLPPALDDANRGARSGLSSGNKLGPGHFIMQLCGLSLSALIVTAGITRGRGLHRCPTQPTPPPIQPNYCNGGAPN